MKRTKRLLISLLTLLCCSTGAWAQNAITIYQKDGQTATFAFSENPVISYSGNDLVMTTTKTTVSYPVYLLEKIDFNASWDEETAVDEVKQTLDTQFSFAGGSLTISGGEAGSSVTVYTVGGVQVGQYSLDSNGCATISVQALGKGIYIVKTKRFTFKFQKS